LVGGGMLDVMKSLASADATIEAPAPELAVDLTLIDEMLALDPTERLRLNDRTVDMLEDLRRGLDPDEPPR